jgi:exodeoxyribonuclease-5
MPSATRTTAALTPHQQAAYDDLYDRLEHGERFTTLRGYAGTGKTYLVSRLVEQLVDEEATVTLCAPTHKAAQVLRDQLDTAVPTQTLHSFLGLRLVPDQQGDYVLAPEGEGYRSHPGGIVVVDEASMVGAEEWRYVQETPMFFQWLFVGDPAQLPPVNETASPAFELPGPMLEEVHRQAADNPILDLATRIRTGTLGRVQSRFANGKGVAITRGQDAFLDSILRAFRDAGDADGTAARVLAYRNRTVRRYNRAVRARLHGTDAPRFVEGEWLVGRATWFHRQVPFLKNSEEVRIETIKEDVFEAEDMSEWVVWALKVRAPGEASRRTLYVLHEGERERYGEELARRRAFALEEPRGWAGFYELKERFARVDYAYASTVHKAQGSTFDTVFVDHRDLCACRGAERDALLYVAVTRPARRLALLV